MKFVLLLSAIIFSTGALAMSPAHFPLPPPPVVVASPSDSLPPFASKAPTGASGTVLNATSYTTVNANGTWFVQTYGDGGYQAYEYYPGGATVYGSDSLGRNFSRTYYAGGIVVTSAAKCGVNGVQCVPNIP